MLMVESLVILSLPVTVKLVVVESIGHFSSTCYGQIGTGRIDARLAKSIYPRFFKRSHNTDRLSQKRSTNGYKSFQLTWNPPRADCARRL